MPLFRYQDNQKLVPIRREKIELEQDIQTTTEQNLETIFGLELVASEFSLNNLRIDTLAYDPETNSFVIIEYKRDRSFHVIDQGFAYLSLMLNNKAEFILEYNEQKEQNLQRDDVDWSQSRVIFIANSFTSHQQEAINFKDLPIELWEVQKYEQNLISFSQVKTSTSSESIQTLSGDETIQKVSKEIKKYSVEDHFKEDWNNARNLFESFNERVLNMDERIEESPVKHYIGYKINGNLVINVVVRKSKLVLRLQRVQPKDIKDPEGCVEYIEHSHKNWNVHVSRFNIVRQEDIEYAVFLVRQLLDKFTDEF